MAMKNLISGSLVLAALISASQSQAQNQSANSNNIVYTQQYKEGMYTSASYDNQEFTLNDFYENLAPYGQWLFDVKYGYVWSPNVDENFKPYYTNGNWALTDYGNVWVSNYQWGWACFHYGRWKFDSYYGWLWFPGSNWGPAWVAWKESLGHIGWAPLSPDYEYNPKNIAGYTCPKDWWIFIDAKYLYSDNYFRYYTGPFGNSKFLKSAESVSNESTSEGITTFSGPTQMQMAKYVGKSVRKLKLLNSASPHASFQHNDLVKMFKPMYIKPTYENGDKIVPPDYVTLTKPIKTVDDEVNANSGTPPGFRNDLPSLVHTTVHPTELVNKQEVKNEWYDQHRADKAEYKTVIKTNNPDKKGSYQWRRKTLATLPTQGNQIPEPVPVSKRKVDEPIKKEQHADPVPDIPTPNATERPQPKQKPEPLPAGR